eukprot:TRINITY_DN10649_c0_g1_i1.p1 TRINITY_DN10649_c0_g1~~TRINITY_DN10649_c0_g1_i1.p1  ORF type:complete len:576 (+),score=196.68 TRINITY_DN10649_c0_g1_i1:136-1863(+)
MDLLQSLKQAADEAAGHITLTAAEGAAPEGDSGSVEALPREELVGVLREREVAQQQAETRYTELQAECEELRQEYGEYRAKVKAWRRQAQLDRDAAKSMVLSLRSAASPEGKDEAYVGALKEQIAQLKESFRQASEKAEKSAHERDVLDRKWREEFSDYNLKIEQWKARRLAGAAASPQVQRRSETPGSMASPDVHVGTPSVSGGVDVDDELMGMQKDREIDHLTKQLKEASARHASLEAELEAVKSQGSATGVELQRLIETHESELARIKDGSQAKYIKDLEAELKSWRLREKEFTMAGPRRSESCSNADHGNASGSPPSSRSGSPPGSPVPTADALHETVEDLTRQNIELTNALTSLKAKSAHLDSDAGERERALGELHAENTAIRQQLEAQARDVAEAAGRVQASERAAEELREQQAEYDEQLEASEEKYRTLQKSNLNLQKDIGRRNETIRQLRAEVVSSRPAVASDRRQTQAVAQPGPGGGLASPSGHHGPSNSSPGGAQPLTLASLLHWRRLRVVLALVFLLLFVTSSILTSHHITHGIDDELTAAQCKKHVDVAVKAALANAKAAASR